MSNLEEIIQPLLQLDTPLEVAQMLAERFDSFYTYRPEQRKKDLADLIEAIAKLKSVKFSYQDDYQPLLLNLVRAHNIPEYSTAIQIAFTEISDPDDKIFFLERLLQTNRFSISKAKAFSLLMNNGIKPCAENLAHFDAIQRSSHSEELANTILVMQNLGMKVSPLTKKLYQNVYQLGLNQKFSQAFQHLNNIGLPFSVLTSNLYMSFVRDCGPRAIETVQAFERLIKHGIVWNEENELFYFAHLRNIWNSETLNACLTYLTENNIPFKGLYIAIYAFCFGKPIDAIKRATMMATLLKISPERNPKALCKKVYDNADNVQYINQAFDILISLGINLEAIPVHVLQNIIDCADDNLINMLRILVQGYQPDRDNHDYILTLIHKMIHFNKFDRNHNKLYQFFQKTDLPMACSQHQDLYDALLSQTQEPLFQAYHFETLLKLLRPLTTNINLTWIKKLFIAIILGNQCFDIKDNITYLIEHHIPLTAEHLIYYEIACWGQGFKKLLAMNLTPSQPQHRPIYLALSSNLSPRVDQSINDLVETQIRTFFTHNQQQKHQTIDRTLVRDIFQFEPDNDIPDTLVELVASVQQQLNVAYGPCEKNRATIVLEKLIGRLCHQSDSWHAALKQTEHADELVFDGIGFSLFSLCRDANFSHLVLDDATIDIVAEKMKLLGV